MLICLFRLEDVGPNLVEMVLDRNVEFDQDTIDKFTFSGSVTYSLVFQGMVTLEDMSSELYGPFPFAFSSGFVQYAFSFIAADKTMKDKRMKEKTLGLIIMLVPEMVSKIDTFREELAKVLLYKFHKVYKINQVNTVFLKDIISSYNKILQDLLSFKQADLLSEQILAFLQVKERPRKKETIIDIGIIYPKEYTSFIKKYYASLLGSLPYTETAYSEDKAVIKTQTHAFSFVMDSKVEDNFLNKQSALILLANVKGKKFSTLYQVLKKLKSKPKIALVVSLPDNIEKASGEYAKFFTGLQRYIGDLPFFSASFNTNYEFKTKMLEALFWTLSPD
ncbi:MAG: hypothetical protein GPJ51_13470 [Candidatus Heimdallarchaeota archaeon]|nr:hypothetical protein [Candidatus Heimdallarchaeota archaeon]